MTNKIYLVTDLGPGDGGKGGVVHRIATMLHAHTIIKVGGAQGSHGVRTSGGLNFNFSQWGCGTLEGIRTHISNRLIVSPDRLLVEEQELRYQGGVHNAFDLLTIDKEALCSTPYHGIASHLKELARGNNPRGTIGTGVGEACRYLERHPELAIYCRDLKRTDILDQLAAVREQIREDLEEIIEAPFLPEDAELVAEEIDLLNNDDYLGFNAKQFREVAKRAHIVDHGYLGESILSKDGVAVAESSHGILTDHYHGFDPHTSAIRTLPKFTHAMLADAGFNGQIVNIGVHRAYQIRHGAGPMPTADPQMAESLLPGSHKEENRWQGKVRVGPLDFVLLRYAINVCGGPKAFDGLAVTWFDQIVNNGEWHICNRYSSGADNRTFFTPSGEIIVRCDEDNDRQLEYQKNLGQQLAKCEPEILTHAIPSAADKEQLYKLCADVVQQQVQIPVRMVSLGPTERDKMCK